MFPGRKHRGNRCCHVLGVIPCHRVLAAGGKVGGFSASGGSAAKIRMLALEGVQVESARPAQQSFGF